MNYDITTFARLHLADVGARFSFLLKSENEKSRNTCRSNVTFGDSDSWSLFFGQMGVNKKEVGKSLFEVVIDYDSSVNISDFSKSLNALEKSYKGFLLSEYGAEAPVNAELRIERIQEKCILVQIQEIYDFTIPFLDGTDTLVAFGGYISTAYKFLKRKSKSKDSEERKYTIEELKQLKDILAPGKDVGASMTMKITDRETQKSEELVSLDSLEAAGVIERIKEELKEADRSEESPHLKQLFYFDTTTREDSSSHDFGCIDKIHPKRLRVDFEDKEDEKKMIYGEFNPVKCSFIVDVEVLTKDKKPYMYRIIHLHEIIEDDVTD